RGDLCDRRRPAAPHADVAVLGLRCASKCRAAYSTGSAVYSPGLVQENRRRVALRKTMPTAFVSSPRFVEHDTGPHHPERADRIRAIHRAVREAKMIQSPDP